MHVELQAKFESDFGIRLLKYNALLLEKYKLPVYSVVIFSFSRPTKMQSDVLDISFGDLSGLHFPYKVVQLNRLDWREYANRLNPVAVAFLAKMKVAPEDRVEVKLQCMRDLIALRLDRKQEAIVSEFIDTYLVLSESEEHSYELALERMNATERGRIMEVRMSWRERGKAEGKALGEALGRAEGEALGRAEGEALGKAEGEALGRAEGEATGSLAIVSRLLNKVIGALSPSTVASLNELSVEQLQALTDHIFDFHRESDLTDWLAAQKQKS